MGSASPQSSCTFLGKLGKPMAGLSEKREKLGEEVGLEHRCLGKRGRCVSCLV